MYNIIIRIKKWDVYHSLYDLKTLELNIILWKNLQFYYNVYYNMLLYKLELYISDVIYQIKNIGRI